MIETFLKFVDGLARLSAWVAAALLAVLAVLGMAEILSRALFNYSIPIAFEYSSYMLAFIMFGGSAWALREGGHIRVTLIMGPFGPRARRLLDIGATAIATAVSLYLTYAVIVFMVGTYTIGTNSFFPSETPLYIPQLGLVFGVLLLTLALLARLIRLFIGAPTEAGDSKKALGETTI